MASYLFELDIASLLNVYCFRVPTDLLYEYMIVVSSEYIIDVDYRQ